MQKYTTIDTLLYEQRPGRHALYFHLDIYDISLQDAMIYVL